MQLLINCIDGTVSIDGVTHRLDLREIQPEIARVHWFDDHGEINFRDGHTTGLGDVWRFKAIIDAWHEKQNAMRTRQ